MPGDDDTGIEWVERDSRTWVLFAHQPDQLTARMTVTYLETGGVEARVGSQGGRYCVEVPEGQLEQAYTVYTPPDSGVLPPMQEDSGKTGVHTGRRLRQRLTETAPPEKGYLRLGLWALRLAVIAIMAGLLLLVFAD
jgi:hypothetical protein